MTERGESEALATAKSLTGALEGMTAQLSALTAYGKKNRHLIAGLAVSLTLDLILTVFVAVTAIQAHDANTSAQAARAVAVVAAQNNRNLCLSNNVARAQSIELWDYLLALPPAKGAPPPSAQQKERVAAFRAFLDKVYQPRNCVHVSPGNP